MSSYIRERKKKTNVGCSKSQRDLNEFNSLFDDLRNSFKKDILRNQIAINELKNLHGLIVKY